MHLSDYQDASFRGVPFLVPENTGPFGRNAVEHLYPDSEQHYVEDNGKLLRKYSFPAILHGSDVKSRFLALQSAIETPGPGTLMHPNFGAVFVQMGECSFDITQRDAGVVTVTINCCEAGSPSLPSLVTGSGVAISGLTASALIAMADLFKENFIKPLSPVSASTIRKTLDIVTKKISSSFSSVDSVSETITDIVDPGSIYQSARLANSLHSLFRAPVQDEDLESTNLHEGWSKVIRDAQPLYESFKVTTLDLKNRDASLSAIQSFYDSAVLVHFAESISFFRYVTADEAIRDQKRLSEAHSTTLKTVLPSVKQLVDEIVTETLEYLSNLQVQLPRIQTMDLSDYPVGTLSYQLYGPENDLTQVLIDINQDRNLMLYDGEVNVLRDGG